MIWPSVMSCAIPRPATMRISVATMGWMPMPATSRPFHAPSSTETPSAAAMAAGAETPCATTSCATTAPAMAMMAPTERSTPPVAMTRVMPSASSMTFAPWFRMSMRVP